MKKICMILCIAVLLTAHSFAELVISPSIGFSNVSIFGEFPLKDLYKSSNFDTDATLMRSASWTPLSFGMDLRFVSGFGFLIGFDNYVSTLGTIDLKSEVRKASDPVGESLKPIAGYKAQAKNVTGFFWESNLVGGFSFKGISRLRINLELGLGLGVGKLNTALKTNTLSNKLETDMLLFTVGVPVRFDVQYFFAKYAGIQLSLCDAPSFGFAVIEKDKHLSRLHEQGIKEDSTAAIGVSNILRVTIGPVFKL